jgi:signal transduction histidine kinase
VSSGASHGPRTDAVYAVLAAVPTAVMAVDEESSIRFVNALAEELFGYPPGALVGEPLSLVLPGGPVAGDRHPGRRRDLTEFPMDVTLTSLDTEDGQLLAMSLRDLTRRRELEGRSLDLSRAYLSLVEMYQVIVRAPDEAALLAETCRIAVEQGGYLGAWVARVEDDGVVRKVAAAGDVEAFLGRLTLTLDPAFPEGRGPSARALREGRPVFSSELRRDPTALDLRTVAREFGIRSSATLPLRRDGRTVAVLALYSARDDFFDEEMRVLVEAVSENVSLALGRFAVTDRLRADAAERRELARRLVMAQEEERARIAADVHDDSVQSLAAVDLRLGMLLRQVSEVAPQLVPDVEKVQAIVGTVAAGLRDLLFDLETVDSSEAMPGTLREVADHIFEDTCVRSQVAVDTAAWDGHSTLTQSDRGQALRIVKEALINVRKHADAENVAVTIVPGERGVEVTVSDDGAGFDPSSTAPRPGHRGLATIRDRAEVSGGWARVESDSGGTTIRFWMPYAEGGSADGT